MVAGTRKNHLQVCLSLRKSLIKKKTHIIVDATDGTKEDLVLPFTKDELDQAVVDGLVTARRHSEYPYTIYNYSDTVQFSRQWDKVTLACRGLILDDDFNIIARPWEKFFNLGERPNDIQFDDPVEVMDKADGSLGILYPTPDGTMAIATRGSFHSEQAEHATKLWLEKYEELHGQEAFGGGDYTYLFEIVYPENRIVLNYDGMDDLILLGAVHPAGYYHGPRQAAAYLDWTGPVVKVFDYNTISEALSHVERPNAEGYVIRSHNTLVKVKQPDYLELHRLRFNMTPKRIWEALSTGRSLEEIVKPLPDEFQSEIMAIGDDLKSKYKKISLEISREWQDLHYELPYHFDRREFAIAAQKKKHRGALFSIYDEKYDAVEHYTWKAVKPSGDEV